jgi:hypothetical protein
LEGALFLGNADAVNLRNFFAELKRRNVYNVPIAYAVIAWLAHADRA